MKKLLDATLFCASLRFVSVCKFGVDVGVGSGGDEPWCFAKNPKQMLTVTAGASALMLFA